MRSTLAALVVSGALALAGPGAAALAQERPPIPSADEHASCLGLGSSTAGPAQFRDNVAHNVQAFAAATGTTPGAVTSELAQRHPGTLQGCTVPGGP